jgi:hypothetical protein
LCKINPKSKPINVEELADLMQEVFAQGGMFRFLPTGNSMQPMLYEQRDVVLLCSPQKRPPKKYDVVLYRRDNGQYVLHRIVGGNRKGYLLCGDHQYCLEKNIREDQMIGVLDRFVRNGKQISIDSLPYRWYAILWTSLRPVRRIASLVFHKLRRFFRYKRLS